MEFRRVARVAAEPGPQAWRIRPAVSREVAAPARRDRDAIRRRDDHHRLGGQQTAEWCAGTRTPRPLLRISISRLYACGQPISAYE
jgi:hypothetical protein